MCNRQLTSEELHSGNGIVWQVLASCKNCYQGKPSRRVGPTPGVLVEARTAPYTCAFACDFIKVAWPGQNWLLLVWQDHNVQLCYF